LNFILLISILRGVKVNHYASRKLMTGCHFFLKVLGKSALPRLRNRFNISSIHSTSY